MTTVSMIGRAAAMFVAWTLAAGIVLILPGSAAVVAVVSLTIAFVYVHGRERMATTAAPHALTIACVIALTMVFALAIGTTYERLFYVPQRAPDMFTNYAQRGGLAAIAVYALQIGFGPLVEEFTFRGRLQRALQRFGAVSAIAITALLFAAVHGDVARIPYFFAAGVVFGAGAFATGSIWVAVLQHAAFNATLIAAATLPWSL